MLTQASTRPKIENKYYQRAVGTARPCWICYKETTTVLATLGKEDFIYVCPSHLTDRGFASPVAPASPTATGPSKEEIGKVIAEYEAKEKKRKAAEKDKKGMDKDKNGKRDEDEADSKKEDKGGSSKAYLTPSAPPTPTHNVYTLHRDIYQIRLAELKKKENLVKAQAVSKELPKAPSNAFPLSRPRPTGDGGGVL